MPEPRRFKLRQAEQRPNNYTGELPPIDEDRITAVLVRRSKKVKPLSDKELEEFNDIDATYIESRQAQLELVNYARSLYRTKPPKVKLYDEGDGVSGQKRIDEREEMDQLYQDLGDVGTIVAAREDRLFRNEHLDQVGIFTKRAKEKKIKLIIPPISSAGKSEETRVYDFTNPEHLAAFQKKMIEAYGYITGHVKYMNQCQQNKADKGGYDGRVLPPGFAVKGKKQNQTIVIYEPWGEKMKWLAKRAQALDWNTGKLNREVANMAYLFPEIPDEDRERYIFKTTMTHIPGVGYKPRKPQTIKDWLTNVMYIGWFLPDDEKPEDTIENHHDAILDYALFAEGYARLKGYTLEGETVENLRGITRIRKEREAPPEALFHGRLLTPPPSPDRTAYVNVIPDRGFLFYKGCSAQPNGIYIDNLFSIWVEPFDNIVIERLKVLIAEDKEIADKVKATLEQMSDQQGETFASILDQLKGIEAQLEDLLAYREVIGEKIVQEEIKLKKAKEETSTTLQMWEGKLVASEKQEHAFRSTLADLERKKERFRIVDSPEEINKVYQLLSKFDKVWPQWDLTQRQRAFSLLINRIEVEVISPHWLHLSIDWIDALGTRIDDALIWRASGTRGEPLSEYEEEIIKQYYPSSPRLEILKLLPDRTWYAIQFFAGIKGISRGTKKHNDIPFDVCYRDFMPKLDGNYLLGDYETTLKYIKEACSNTSKSTAPLYAFWLQSAQLEDQPSLVERDLNGVGWSSRSSNPSFSV